MNSLWNRNVLVLDGGMGTTLQDEHGIAFGPDTPTWSSHLLLSDPDTLKKAQHNFAQAGADIILTPTYQASRAGLAQSRVGGKAPADEQISQALNSAIQISKSAAGSRNGLVALSLGAYGATLQPSQEYSGDYGSAGYDELVKFHGDRIKEFAPSWPDIDLIAFETLPRVDEVKAVKAVVDGAKPFWISCVFPNDSRLPDGTTIEAVLQVMLQGEPKPWAIGMNCTKIEKIAGLVQEFEDSADKLGLTLPRLVIYPDGTNGTVYDTASGEWVGSEKEGATWDEQLVDMVKGVQQRDKWTGVVVGGCCKASPSHIASLRKGVDTLLASR